MFLLDEYKRNFVRWGSRYVDRHLEDPSYVGFQIKFKFDELFENKFDDIVPGGLLYIDQSIGVDDWVPRAGSRETALGNELMLTSTSNFSALSYLEHLEEQGLFRDNKKSQLLKGMIGELIFVQNKTPWFFKSIDGLDSAFKIAREGYRTGDAGQITIETLESIDRRISFIIDAYRKVAWDMRSMSWILPQNLRKFGMEIMVIEFNAIHTKDNLYQLSQESFTNELKFLENNFPGAYNILRKSEGRVQKFKGVFDTLGAEQPNVSDLLSAFFVLDLFTKVSVQVFQLHECEFDVLGDYAFPYLENISMHDAGEPIENSIPITFKRSNVISNYSLLEFLLSDKTDVLPNDNSSTFSKYFEYYFKNRDSLADDLVVKKAKDIAKATLAGNYNPVRAAANVASGTVRNLSSLPRDLI